MSRTHPWPQRRSVEWARRFGALPSMRMAASWSGPPLDHRIQGCCGSPAARWRAPLRSDRPGGCGSAGPSVACQKPSQPGGGQGSRRSSRRPVGMWTIGCADRLRSPRFPSKARKAGRCSPSPTYPQAQQTTTGSIDDKLDPPPPPPPAQQGRASSHLTSKAPYKDGLSARETHRNGRRRWVSLFAQPILQGYAVELPE